MQQEIIKIYRQYTIDKFFERYLKFITTNNFVFNTELDIVLLFEIIYNNNDYDIYNYSFSIVEKYIKDFKNQLLFPNITLDFIVKNAHKIKDWNIFIYSNVYLHQTNNIIMDIINKFPDKNWDWDKLFKLENITTDFIEKYPEKQKFINFSMLSYNRNISLEFIEKNLDKNWNIYLLSQNQNITIDFVIKHFYSLNDNNHNNDNIPLKWDLEYITINIKDGYTINLNYDLVSKSKYYFKSWNYLILNNIDIPMYIIDIYMQDNICDWMYYLPNIMEIYLQYCNSDWNYYLLAISYNITLEFFEKYILPKIDIKYLFSSSSIYTDCNIYKRIYKTLKKKINMDIIKKYYDNDCYWDSDIYFNFCDIDFLEEHYDDYPENIFWNRISRNIFLTPEFIEKYIDKSWDWTYISRESYISIEFITKHINKPWDFKYILYNKNITLEFFEKYFDNKEIIYILQNENYNSKIIINIVEKYPFYQYNWYKLSFSPYITLDFLIKNFDKLSLSKVLQNSIYIIDIANYYRYEIIKHLNLKGILVILDDNYINKLSNNHNITIEFIENNLDIINFYYISQYNNNITSTFIDKYIDKNWNFNTISYRSNLSIKFIHKHINKLNFKHLLLYNKNIMKLFDIIENIDNTHNIYKNKINKFWFDISFNKYITMDFVEKYIDKPWSIYNLTYNPNFNITFFETYYHKKKYKNVIHKIYNFLKNIFSINQNNNSYINYYYYNNENISFKYIINNPYKNWKFSNFYVNRYFLKEKELFFEQEFRKWLSARKIQIWYKNRLYNPNYLISNKFIKNLFSNFYNYFFLFFLFFFIFFYF
jgi:hypothetical protein